ncbi:MAG: hypothetical protein HY914_08605 [Desulfomonile tiedjei]|nr:hypothetical protein [Desulfomonile tiedjei]
MIPASGLRSRIVWIAVLACLCSVSGTGTALGQIDTESAKDKDGDAEFTWQMPGRVSIHDLQFGSAEWKDGRWEFLGNNRSFSAGVFKNRLTLMVRFSYMGSKPDTEIKFIVRLPGARHYEETVRLASRSGQFSYRFTIHNPENFIGTGSVSLYYGFSMVDLLDFTIMPGT